MTDLTRLNGQEYPGLVMLTLIALKGLLHERVDESWHDDIVSVLWMMLTLNEQMSLPSISSTELEVLDNHIKVFLHKYKEGFGHVALANSKVGLKKINSMLQNTLSSATSVTDPVRLFSGAPWNAPSNQP